MLPLVSASGSALALLPLVLDCASSEASSSGLASVSAPLNKVLDCASSAPSGVSVGVGLRSVLASASALVSASVGNVGFGFDVDGFVRRLRQSRRRYWRD